MLESNIIYKLAGVPGIWVCHLAALGGLIRSFLLVSPAVFGGSSIRLTSRSVLTLTHTAYVL